jgi:hypothetical protein
MALWIFGFSYVIRVIRNTVLVILWDPCYTVNYLFQTSSANFLFYILCDFVPVAIILKVHKANYS